MALIVGIQGDWQFDDTNYTDFPIGTTTLVADQYDYAFDSTHLEIVRIGILNKSDSKYYFINPVDRSQFSDPLETLYPDSGMPMMYDKDGKSILLYPAPSADYVTLAAGMKVYFQRTADIFTSAQVTTGTKTPGFASPWHYILAYKAAIPYCMKYKPNRVAAYMAEVARMEKELKDFYGRRERDTRKRLENADVAYQ